MAKSKHVFFQVDTTAIIECLLKHKDISREQILNYTLMYDQGSMILGHHIKGFNINVESRQDIYFTILPLRLFSHDKLFFKHFSIAHDPEPKIPIKCPDQFDHALSFKITIGDISDRANPVAFKLLAVIEVGDGPPIAIEICIDPNLQAVQNPPPPVL